MHQREKVLLYELNEVPWSVVDRYVARRPGSAVAELVAAGLCRTTVDDDPVHLQPWRTWPTVHASMHTEEHGSFDLGQDPETFRGTPLWDVVADAGMRVGLFGPLQSWPPKAFPQGFHVPDTFAADPATEPAALSRFQAFNLHMTRANGFASDAPLELSRAGLAALDLVRHGMTARTAASAARQLVSERRDRRRTAARPLVQAAVTFDLYWRLHRRHDPHLSVYFTNHVAGVMHRFWGDAMPGYADGDRYEPDPVYGGLIDEAMDITDGHLRRIAAWRRRHPDTVVVLASSMGQEAIPYRAMESTYVVTDAASLAEGIGLDGAVPLLAMYPRSAFSFPSAAAAEEAAEVIAGVTTTSGPLFGDVRTFGASTSFEIDYRFDDDDLPRTARLPDGTEVDLATLGIHVRARPGGGNTAFHCPEGIFVASGAGISPDPSRRVVDVLDVAPSLLGLLGLDPAPSMRGAASIFGPAPRTADRAARG